MKIRIISLLLIVFCAVSCIRPNLDNYPLIKEETIDLSW